jgi:hypothetical protein
LVSTAGCVGDDEEGSMRGGPVSPWRCYALRAFAFFAVFAFFSFVLWGASKSHKPHVVVKVVAFLASNPTLPTAVILTKVEHASISKGR